MSAVSIGCAWASWLWTWAICVGRRWFVRAGGYETRGYEADGGRDDGGGGSTDDEGGSDRGPVR